MAEGFHVAVEGATQVETMLTGLGLDLKDMRDAMDEVGTKAIKVFSGQVFASRGSFLGQPWPALSPRYAAQKARRYPGRPPLIRTGAMQRSFTKGVEDMSVTIGNSDFKFPYHQSSAPHTKVPRRVMLGVYEGMQNDITNAVADSLTRKIRQRTGR